LSANSFNTKLNSDNEDRKKKRGGGRIVLFLAQNVCHMYRMYAVTLVRK